MKKLIAILTLVIASTPLFGAGTPITANGTIVLATNLKVGETYAIKFTGGFDSSSNSVETVVDDQRTTDTSDDTWAAYPYADNPFTEAGGMQFIADSRYLRVVTTSVASAATIEVTLTEKK